MHIKEKKWNTNRGSSYGEMADVLDFYIVGCEFEFQSRYYVHFWINTFGEDMNFLIPHPTVIK